VTWVSIGRSNAAIALLLSTNFREAIRSICKESSLRGTWIGCRFKEQTCRVRFVRSLQKLVACLCLVLTCGSAIALVAHHHSSATDAIKCTICITAHSAAPEARTNPQRASFRFIGFFRPEPISLKLFSIAFALTVRPPPQG
jgi:hypothetical protein